MVLPRLGDAVWMLVNFLRALMTMCLWFPGTPIWSESNFSVELVTGDFSDAYYHFRVAEEEHRHCLSPDVPYTPEPAEGEPAHSGIVMCDTMLLWIHMCFGLKAAPLLWCRFAAAVARMLAGMFDFTESLQQLYLDDPLLVVAGTAEQRRYLIAMYFLTVRMLGISMAWHKTARGLELVWIGVLFRLDLEKGLVVVTLPEKTVTLLRNEAAAMSLKPWSESTDFGHSSGSCAGCRGSFPGCVG